MDKLQQLYNLYLDQGIITEAVSFEEFSGINKNQQEQLFDLGKQSGLFVTTTVDDFLSVWPTEPATSVRADVRERDLKKKDSESLLGDGFSEQPEQQVQTSVRADVRAGDLEKVGYEQEETVVEDTVEEPISVRAQTRESDLEGIQIREEEEEAELLLKEQKMDVLDLALQLPTFDFEELDKQGQDVITEMASKYNLSPIEFLKEAQDKKQAVVDSDFGDWLKNSFKIADVSIGEMIATLPSSAYEFIGAAFSDPINRALGLPETNVEAFKELIGTKDIIEGLVKEQEYREKQDALYRREKGLEGGIVEAFGKGEYEKGSKLLVNAIVQSAPISLGIMAASASGVGLIPLATGATALMTGPELRKQLENNPDQTKALSVLKAVGMAGAEMVFSTISQGTLARVYKDIIFQQGKKEGVKVFKKTIIGAYEGALKKFGPLAAGAGEAIEEVATQITQNLIEGKPVFQGVPDAAVTGFASGGVYGAPITAIQATKYANEGVAKWKIKNKIKKSEYSDIVGVFDTQDITELQFDLADTKRADEILTAELKRRVDTGEMTKEDSDRIQKNFFETSIYKARLEPKNLTTEQKVKAINLLKEKQALLETINTIDEKSLSIQEQTRVDEIDEQLAELVTITETIKTEEDAISKQSPEGVDVQEQARDGEELGEGDPTGGVTGPLTPKEDETTEVPEEEVAELTKEQKDEVSDLEYSLGLKPQKTKQKKESPVEKEPGVEIIAGIKPIETLTVQKGKAIKEKIDDNLSYTYSKNRGYSLFEDDSIINERKKVIKEAQLAAKAIKTILPNTNIDIFDDQGVYNVASDYNLGSAANYNFLTRDIQVNVSLFEPGDVAHEVFHAVVDSKLKSGAITIDEMVSSVRKALSTESDIIKRIDEFAELYESSPELQNEERLADLMSLLASEYKTLSKPKKNKILQFLKKLAKKLGFNIELNEFTKTDEDVINLLNVLSGKVSRGEEITETDVEILEDGTNPIGEPTEINIPKPRQKKIKFNNSYNLSLVTPNNRIDLLSLIKDINTNKQKVWFWVADQLGIGEYDGIQLDAGPSFALDGEAVWASSKSVSEIQKNIDKADYLFIISGSPQRSLLFNKKVYEVFTKKLGDYNTFKQQALETKPIKAIADILNEFDSWEALRESPKRKAFLNGILQQQRKPNTAFHKYIKGLDGFVDVEELRDGFYRDNNFEQNDIMVVIKPTGVKEGSTHSTYANEVLGEVVGVPDTKVDAFEIMPKEIADKYREDLTRSEKAQVVAPYGSGIKEVAPKPRQRLAPIEGEEITIEAVVEQGRAQGFSDAAIKAVLIGRGFKASDINTALEEALRKGETLPAVFRTIPDGLKFFRSLRSKINRFKNTTNKKTKEKPSNAEVRARALEILQNTQEYKNLPENQQNELVLAIDKFVGSRANKTIQREITRIKNLVRGFKKGVKDLRAAQIELKNFIRTAMPKSQGYSDTDIANAISIVTDVKSINDLSAAIERVIKKVETARERKKKSLITKLQKFVSSKAKVISTGSKRRKSKGLDPQGQQFFSQVSQILKAALGSKPIDRMAVIANELSDIDRYNEIIAKEARGEKLSVKDSKFLDKSIAFEMFADIKDKSLEDVQALFEDLQSGAEISRQAIKEKRLRKAEKDAKIQEEVTSQIKKDFAIIFKTDKNGKKVLKSIKEIRADIKEINKSFAKLKIWEGLKKLYENYDFTVGKNISAFFRTKIAHLGSLTRILDNYATTGFFQEQVYDRLNIMSENSLRGKFYQQKIIDSIADSVEGIEGGYSGVLEKLQKIGIKEITEGNKKVEYTADQIMRMYALSLNDVQRERLRNEGIKNIEEIKDILGPELVSFTDKIVEYLSNDYFESLNDVYSDVNDTNLGYVENYFPTASISDADQAKLIDGDFNSVLGLENASSLKERTAKDLELNLDFGFSYTLENYINSMERYKSYASGTRELNTIFNTEAVKTLIDKNVLDVGDLIKTSINYEINPTYGLRNESKDSTRKVFSWFTSYALSFKFIQIFKQMTSFVNAFNEHQFRPGKYTPVVDTLSFLGEYALVLANFRSNLKKMKEVSATFRERLEKGLEGDIYSLESGGLFQYLPETSAKATRLRRNFRKAAAFPTVLGDVLGVMGYVANYNRNIKNGMSEAEALKAFNNYNATQQSRRNTEKSPIQRAKGYNRVFTAFGSTLYLQMNRVAMAQRNVFAKHLLKGKVPPTKDVRDLALNLSIANMLFVATSHIGKLWAGDDEDRKEVYLAIAEAAAGINLLYQIPLFGIAAEQVVQRAEVGLGLRKRARTSSGIVNPFNAFWYKLNRFIKDPTFFSAFKGMVDLILGVQTDPAVGVINLFKDMEADEGEIYDIIGISKSYRPKERKKPKPPPN